MMQRWPDQVLQAERCSRNREEHVTSAEVKSKGVKASNDAEVVTLSCRQRGVAAQKEKNVPEG
jgi:hypothetical protein